MIVLDVACGAGHAADPIAPHVRQIVGIDLTAALLRVGAQRLAAVGIQNVLLQEARAEALPFIDESFDVVFCRSSLHHFEDPVQVVAEMVRVCRRGGRVVLLDLVAPSDDIRGRFDDIHRLIDPSHRRTFLENELAELLPGGRAGLAYADTTALRLPIDITLTDQSERAKVMGILRAELDGRTGPTGFEPAEEDGKVVVSFATCVVHTVRR
jgi:SAM-dependent methyltransferase